MKKRKENQFIEKFHLLNSQETSEEINWSCSDSSEYEDHDTKQCKSLKNVTNIRRKRKRCSNRKREPKNHSSLEISFTDTMPECKNVLNYEKSPTFDIKSKSELLQSSPILTTSHRVLPRLKSSKNYNNTPKLSPRNCDLSERGNQHQSPIIILKSVSPNVSPRVKKRLFEPDKFNEKCLKNSSTTRSKSPILNRTNCLDKKKCSVTCKENNNNHNQCKDNSIKGIAEKVNKILNKEQNKPNLEKENNSIFNNRQKETLIKSTSPRLEEHTANKKMLRPDLVAKVKTYFDSYFSSQSSQQSISECETSTPSSSSNADEIEIINPITQVRSITPSLKGTNTVTSFESHIDITKSKKVKYKKGGLAYRLNGLLKKQNSSVCLWQHERFLAANSNFVIPKEEFLAFQIKNIDFNYSIYLLEVVDVNNDKFFVVINSSYVSSNHFEIDNILKIYEPYSTVHLDKYNCKILINVCKFMTGKLTF